MRKQTISMSINGKQIDAEVDARMLLVHFLREQQNLTGTHIGCDTSHCGVCTVDVDGHSIKSCTTLAVQCHGKSITTVEGLASGGVLHAVQLSFSQEHGLQCGFCTAGILISLEAFLREQPEPSEQALREVHAGERRETVTYFEDTLGRPPGRSDNPLREGVAQGTTDLIAGQIQMQFNSPATALAHMQAGRVRAIGVTTANRVSAVPAVPTINEAGLANTIARVKASWSKLPMEQIEEIQIQDGTLAGRPCRQIDLVNTEAARGKLEFHRTTVWFDMATGLLAGLDGHGWPAAGEKEGDLLESYHYHEFRPNPALPNHHFTR